MNPAEVTSSPSPSTIPRTAARLDYLDGIRALAAMYVVLHHIWLTTYPDYPRNTGPAILSWLVYGHVAVAVFIVVSGFSLSIAPARRDWELKGGIRTFMQRRAWRILPTYWAALALSCAVFALVTPDLTGDKVSLRAIVVHGLLLQDVVNSPKPNGAFWSIALEWQIYFLFPLVLLLRRRLGVRWMTALLTGGVVLSYIGATEIGALQRLLNLTPQFFALFVFGVAASSLVRRPGSDRLITGLLALSGSTVAIFVTLAVALGPVWIDAQYFWIDLLLGFGTACLVAAMTAGRPRWLLAVLAGSFLRKTGLFSYSMYCVHLPVLWLAWHFLVVPLELGVLQSFIALVVIGMPAVYVFSYAFSAVFEQPFINNRSLRAAWRALPVPRRRREVPRTPAPAVGA